MFFLFFYVAQSIATNRNHCRQTSTTRYKIECPRSGALCQQARDLLQRAEAQQLHFTQIPMWTTKIPSLVQILFENIFDTLKMRCLKQCTAFQNLKILEFPDVQQEKDKITR